MRLRKLEIKDASFMLEWMHDADVTQWLGTNFAEKTMDDCLAFIEKNQDDAENLNLAIVDDNDEYMGTVSLKHIDKAASNAEFAITIRKCAMGLGVSKFAMQEIIRIGHEEIGLRDIYWCVSKKNPRARRFYDKNQYLLTDSVPEKIKNNYSKEQLCDMIWYCA